MSAEQSAEVHADNCKSDACTSTSQCLHCPAGQRLPICQFRSAFGARIVQTCLPCRDKIATDNAQRLSKQAAGAAPTRASPALDLQQSHVASSSPTAPSVVTTAAPAASASDFDFSNTRTHISYHKSSDHARRYLSHEHLSGAHQYNLRSNALGCVVRLECHGCGERARNCKSEPDDVGAREADATVPDGTL